MSILLIAAMLPPLVLLFVMYKMDKVEKEPPGLLLKLLAFGALSCLPAIIFETAGQYALNYLFSWAPPALYYALMYFLVVAWSEEGVKHFALKIGSWKNPNFNYTFDAILYGAAAALGFALLENIMYVTDMGLYVAAVRSVTAIPGHCIFGIYMGYYYGMAKYFDMKGDTRKRKIAQLKSMVIPIILHGFYDYCATMGGDVWSIVFIIFIIILDVFAIMTVRKMAKTDSPLDYIPPGAN